MKKILFINNKNEKCGVYQYGIHVFDVIKNNTNYSFIYVECSNTNEIESFIQKHKPDLIIYNYHEGTLSFVTKTFLNKMQGPLHVCLAHELIQSDINNIDGSFFHYYMFADPVFIENNPLVFKLNRLLFPYNNQFPLPEVPTIGTYGFAGRVKGYHEILRLIEEEFDEAILRINITPHTTTDPEGKRAREFAERLAKSVKKPGIKLDVTFRFMSDAEVLDFLAMNTLNIFLYNPYEITAMRGAISSAVDQAISVGRPIAVSHNPMLRHLHALQPSIIVKYKDTTAWTSTWPRFALHFAKTVLKPCQMLIKHRSLSLCRTYSTLCFRRAFEVIRVLWSYRRVEFNSLKKIIEAGTRPIERLTTEWSKDEFRKNVDDILSKIFTKHDSLNLR